MSKLPLILIIFIISFSGILVKPIDDVKDFVKDLIQKAKEILQSLEDLASKTNNTEVIKLEEKGIESFSQSAQIMKLSGLRDKDLPAFLDRLILRLKMPQEHAQNVTDSLKRIAESKSGEWESFKFIYTKNTTDSTIYYTSILAQHDSAEDKSNWIYTELNSQMNKTDILVLSKTKKIGTNIKEEIIVVRKPLNYTDLDVEIMMKFLELASVKAFGNYLGVEAFPHQNLNFLDEY